MNGTLETTTHFFEGVEKNLEVWFTNSDRNTAEADLRKIPRLENKRFFINECTKLRKLYLLFIEPFN